MAEQRAGSLVDDKTMEMIERHWRRVFWLLFAGAAAYLLFYKWGAIRVLALSDTDDNMRLAQVRALLDGQGWYDLRQYKLNPPGGYNIHWTRIVDLPIAALILIFQPIFGSFTAQQIACTVAPLLALGAALWWLILATRRLIAPDAYPLAFTILMCAQVTLFMWMPLRVDHHGWQLASLILLIAGLADPQQRRGGITVGLATALSLGIGLELIPSMALAGASMVARWAWDRTQAERLLAYAVALSAGCAVAFGGFASYDNRQMVCDALSPVYLSSILLAGGLMAGASLIRADKRWIRIAIMIGIGAIVAAFFVHFFPQCLGRPEQISPELERSWFLNVREAKPIQTKGWDIAIDTAILPVVGTLGAFFAAFRARTTPAFGPWATVALLSFFSTVMLFWQSRYGAQAQLMGVFGATALGWMILPKLLDSTSSLVRVLGSFAAFMLLSGIGVQFATTQIKEMTAKPQTTRSKAIDKANGKCPTLRALRELSPLPPTTMLTMIDLGPRLITMTRHSALAGPYHRNGAAILDVQHAFTNSSPEVAHDVMRRHGATMLLLCPGMSETTVYMARNKHGFYAQLVDGEVPKWLVPVALPAESPYKLWRRAD